MSFVPTPQPATPKRATAPVASLAAKPPGGPNLHAMLAYYVLRDLEQAVDRTERALSEGDPQAPQDEQAAAQRRLFARQLVIGSWLNRNNPAWDPMVPESHAPDPGDPLLAVLAAVAAGAAPALAAAPVKRVPAAPGAVERGAGGLPWRQEPVGE